MSDIRARPSSGANSFKENINSVNTNNSEENSSAFHDLGQRTIDMNEGKEPLLLSGDSHPENDDEDGGVDNEHSKIHVVRVFGRSFNKIVLITHFNVFLYSCCFWIQNAVFPYLSKRMGADPVMFGYLQTTFAVIQLAGGPLFGRFGDLFGSRSAMILAFIASASSYFFLYMAASLPFLFLSRLPSVFMHAMQGGQMIVTDVCDTKERANALAKLGLSYGLGMVGGTLTGGLIAKFFNLETAALVACLGSILSVVIIYTNIPPEMKRAKSDTEESKEGIFSIAKIVEILKAPNALFLMCIKLGTGIPIGIFQSMFSIIALETFQLPADKNSYMMSYIGFLSMLVQGFAINFVTKRYSDLIVLTGSSAILSVSYFLLSWVTNVWQLCVVFLPLVTGLTFKNVIIASALTNTVPSNDTGAILGLNMAVNSFIRALAPTIGGYMLSSFGFPAFGYLGFVTTTIVTAVLFNRLRRERM